MSGRRDRPGQTGSEEERADGAGRLARLRQRWSRWDTVLLVSAILLLVGSGLPLPGYSVAPGPLRAVGDLVEIDGAPVFPPTGQILLPTVALHPLSPFRAFQAWLDGDIKVVGDEDVASSEQRALDMDDSREVAIAVALRHLGFAVPEQGEGALVEQVQVGSPAEGRLAPGDVIVALAQEPMSLASELVDAITSHHPSEVVDLDIVGPDGSRRQERIELGSRPGSDVAFLGAAVRTKERSFDYPFTVRIRAPGVDGNSAGLAFTLGILDVLTPGELTDGMTIGVTGTIETNGDVGPVGSVGQKTVAVREAGAVQLLVPAGLGSEAVAHRGEVLEVLEVATLDQAIAALERLGGEVRSVGRRD